MFETIRRKGILPLRTFERETNLTLLATEGEIQVFVAYGSRVQDLTTDFISDNSCEKGQ